MNRIIRFRVLLLLFAVMLLSIFGSLVAIAYAEPTTEPILQMVDTVTLRTDDNGLRFKAELNKDMYDMLDDNNQLYFIIMPETYMQYIGTDYSKLSKLIVRKQDGSFDEDKSYCLYVNVAKSKLVRADEDTYYAYAGISPVNKNNYALKFVAIACVETKISQTEYTYTYAVPQTDIYGMPSTSLYDTVNSALFDVDNSIDFIESQYSWLGDKDYPINVDNSNDYDKFVSIVNSGHTFLNKTVILARGIVSKSTDFTTPLEATIKNTYLVTFKNYDGNILCSIETVEGELPIYPYDNPTRPSDANYTYSFKDWGEVSTVTGDCVYTANYNSYKKVEKTYVVTHWVGAGLDDACNTVETDGYLTVENINSSVSIGDKTINKYDKITVGEFVWAAGVHIVVNISKLSAKGIAIYTKINHPQDSIYNTYISVYNPAGDLLNDRICGDWFSLNRGQNPYFRAYDDSTGWTKLVFTKADILNNFPDGRIAIGISPEVARSETLKAGVEWYVSDVEYLEGNEFRLTYWNGGPDATNSTDYTGHISVERINATTKVDSNVTISGYDKATVLDAATWAVGSLLQVDLSKVGPNGIAVYMKAIENKYLNVYSSNTDLLYTGLVSSGWLTLLSTPYIASYDSTTGWNKVVFSLNEIKSKFADGQIIVAIQTPNVGPRVSVLSSGTEFYVSDIIYLKDTEYLTTYYSNGWVNKSFDTEGHISVDYINESANVGGKSISGYTKMKVLDEVTYVAGEMISVDLEKMNDNGIELYIKGAGAWVNVYDSSKTFAWDQNFGDWLTLVRFNPFVRSYDATTGWHRLMFTKADIQKHFPDGKIMIGFHTEVQGALPKDLEFLISDIIYISDTENHIITFADFPPYAYYSQLKPYIDCGFNTYVVVTNQAVYDPSNPEECDFTYAIETCKNLGLNVLVHDGGAYFDEIDFNKYSNVIGFYIDDEPQAAEFAQIYQDKVTWVNSKYGDKIFYINLFPSYADRDCLGGGTFEAYLKYYVETISNKINGLDAFGIDHYPLSKSRKGEYLLSDDYVSDLMILAQKVKNSNAERMAVCIQTFGVKLDGGGWRVMESDKDITFQLYTTMAFGASIFEFFPYCSTDEYDAIINGTTDTYNYVKSALAEINKFESVYMQYEWEGAKGFDGSSHNWVYYLKNPKLSNLMDNQLDSLSGVSSFTSDEDTIVGQFKDKNGKKAFMVTNYNDPSKDLTDDVTIKFDSATSVTVYIDGVAQNYNLTDNTLSISLSAGEGAFIILND